MSTQTFRSFLDQPILIEGHQASGETQPETEKQQDAPNPAPDENEDKHKHKPVATVNKGTGKFELDSFLLRKILIDTLPPNTKTVIVSITGPYRKGKSFLLNLFALYLKRKCHRDWMSIKPQERLRGFSWTNSSLAETKGIWLWPEPFNVGGVAVFLMDTEGSFDASQSQQQNVNVTAVCTIVSTVTVYNLQKDLQENNLSYFRYAMKYGQMALDSENDDKPLDELLFLVRDWQHIENHEYGFVGGEGYLNEFFTGSNPEMPKMYEDFRSTFDKLSCFLLPIPHLIVANPKFDGSLSSIDSNFLSYVDDLFVSIVHGIKTRTVHKSNEQLVSEFENYFRALSESDMPRVEDHIVLQRKSHYDSALVSAAKVYHDAIESAVKDLDKSVSNEAFLTLHEKAWKKACEHFGKQKKISRNAETDAEYLKLLEHGAIGEFEKLFDGNQDRFIKKRARLVGTGLVGSGAVAATAACITFFTTAATAAVCASAGIGALVVLGVAGIALIAGGRSKKGVPGYVTKLFPKANMKYEAKKSIVEREMHSKMATAAKFASSVATRAGYGKMAARLSSIASMCCQLGENSNVGTTEVNTSDRSSDAKNESREILSVENQNIDSSDPKASDPSSDEESKNRKIPNEQNPSPTDEPRPERPNLPSFHIPPRNFGEPTLPASNENVDESQNDVFDDIVSMVTRILDGTYDLRNAIIALLFASLLFVLLPFSIAFTAIFCLAIGKFLLK